MPKDRFGPSVVLDEFVIQERLGSGGMGTVFRAHQITLDRPAAIKILHDNLGQNRAFIAELVKEARLAAKLNHPNIIQCYSVGEADSVYFYAMEYVEGKSLKQVLDKKWKLSPAEALPIIRQTAVALEYAWKESRMVHRDIKPDNIMLTHDGTAKLADLGLARPAHELCDESSDVIRGTPQYLCPEAVLGTPMDYRGDMYSLGVVLYQCVTGQFPFDCRTGEEYASAHVHDDPANPTVYSPDLPPEVCYLIETMMAKAPESRFQDPAILIKELERAEVMIAARETVAKTEAPELSAALASASSSQILRMEKAPTDDDDDAALAAAASKNGPAAGPAPTPPGATAESAKRSTGMLWAAVAAAAVLVIVAGVALAQILDGGNTAADDTGARNGTESPGAGPGTSGDSGNTSPDTGRDAAPAVPPPGKSPVAPGASVDNGGMRVVSNDPDGAPAEPPVPAPAPTGLRIASMLVDPDGNDIGTEELALFNGTDADIDLTGYQVRDKAEETFSFTGTIGANQLKNFVLPAGSVRLNNSGDTVYLLDPDGTVLHEVTYDAKDVRRAKGSALAF